MFGKMKYFIIFLFVITPLFTQDDNPIPFDIHLNEIQITELGGLQSFAFAQSNKEWLLIGGRLDGLHRRQPWASFSIEGHNDQIIVVNPETNEIWKHPIDALQSSLKEQLASTNMEFYQDGDKLIIIGGYGFSEIRNDHYTFDNLTVINVPELISSIKTDNSIESSIQQISNEAFQVSGGKLLKIYDTFYLLGGHKFIGRYNPMGPDHGPGFEQEYTNSVRKFKLDIQDDNISVEFLDPYIDELKFHRRDYNALQQILPDGSEGITMFSGVFQIDDDLPYLSAVNVDSVSYSEQAGFQQLLNHYHCPAIPLYSNQNNEMYNIFFGGIAQYYYDQGSLIQDDNVPFVKSIAVVVRDNKNVMEEYLLPIQMPDYLGAGSEFIPNTELNHFTNHVLDFDSFSSDSVFLGYILGGIESSSDNIFFSNTGTQSSASNRIFKVFLKKKNLSSINYLTNSNKMNLITYPNPTFDNITIEFELEKVDDVLISIYNSSSQKMIEKEYKNLQIGKNQITINIPKIETGNQFLIIEVKSSNDSTNSKVILY